MGRESVRQGAAPVGVREGGDCEKSAKRSKKKEEAEEGAVYSTPLAAEGEDTDTA